MMDIVKSVREYIRGWVNGGEASWYAYFPRDFGRHIYERVTRPSSRQLLLKLHSASPNGQGNDDLYTAYNTLLTATLSSWSKHKHPTPTTFVTFVQSVLSGLPSTSSSTTEPSSLTWLGNSLVDMIWSIDIGLDELVAESKSGEGASGIEHQRNAEKDKQAVADLVKKLLVGYPTSVFACGTKQWSRRPLESSSQDPAEKGSIIVWFSLPVLVSTSRTGTNAKSERGQAFCWFNFTLLVYLHSHSPPVTSKTKSTSCGNKPKATANWSRKSPAALAHRTHPLQVCL